MLITFLSISLFLVYEDSKEFTKSIQNEESILLLKEDKILAGIVTKFSGNAEFKALTQEELASYNNQDLDIILKDRFKLFIFELDSFETIDNIDYIENRQLTKEEAFNILRSENPKEFLIPEGMQGLIEFETEESEIKSNLFLLLLIKAIDEQGEIFIFKEYKRGNLVIYPKTIMFKTIKLIPASMLTKVFSIG